MHGSGRSSVVPPVQPPVRPNAQHQASDIQTLVPSEEECNDTPSQGNANSDPLDKAPGDGPDGMEALDECQSDVSNQSAVEKNVDRLLKRNASDDSEWGRMKCEAAKIRLNEAVEEHNTRKLIREMMANGEIVTEGVEAPATPTAASSSGKQDDPPLMMQIHGRRRKSRRLERESSDPAEALARAIMHNSQQLLHHDNETVQQSQQLFDNSQLQHDSQQQL